MRLNSASKPKIFANDTSKIISSRNFEEFIFSAIFSSLSQN
jgi:hypothetical protein